jgi:hypothetical protein
VYVENDLCRGKDETGEGTNAKMKRMIR